MLVMFYNIKSITASKIYFSFLIVPLLFHKYEHLSILINNETLEEKLYLVFAAELHFIV